jgi:hypothetical protein
MVLNRNQNGYAISSQNYFEEWNQLFFTELTAASRSSLCEARQKIHWRAFEYLLQETDRNIHQEGSLPESSRWRGHVVRAIDGTKLTLPHSEEILEYFPQRTSGPIVSHYPFAVMMTAVNVFTGHPCSARIQNMHGSEHEMLLSMLSEFKTGDIALLDRGLISKPLWLALADRGQFHITRLSQGKGRYIASLLLKSNRKELIVSLEVKDPEGLQGEKRILKLRLIRGKKQKDGKYLILITNLLDAQKYPRSAILDLYRKRWEAETLYHRVKNLLALPKFHARTLNGIMQEIYANLLILSWTALLVMQTVQEKRINHSKIMPNFKNATEVMRRHLPQLLELPSIKSQRNALIGQMIDQAQRVLCKKQLGRSYPRYSRQPINKWTFAKKHKLDRFYAETRKAKRRASS